MSRPEAAILESHGIEVASPSCQSNGEDGEMHEFADQVNHRFSEPVSFLGAPWRLNMDTFRALSSLIVFTLNNAGVAILGPLGGLQFD